MLKAMLDGHPRYAAQYQFRLDTGKADGRPCRFDAMVYDRKAGERIIISCKAQHSSGSTEEKVPFELLHLSHSLNAEVAEKAYLVLHGEGFSRVKHFYLSDAFKEYMPILAHKRPWDDNLRILETKGLERLIIKEQL